MGYRAAVFSVPGVPNNPHAHFYCDGCGKTVRVSRDSGQPYAWFLRMLDGKAPSGPMKGWLVKPLDEHRNTHHCPECQGSG